MASMARVRPPPRDGGAGCLPVLVGSDDSPRPAQHRTVQLADELSSEVRQGSAGLGCDRVSDPATGRRIFDAGTVDGCLF